MTLYLAIRYIHFISIFSIAGALVSQHMLLAPQLSKKTITKLSWIDAIYGITAIITVMTGLAMWLWLGKPAEFYSSNPLLHIKVTLAILMGILSIIPTIFFIKQRKGVQDDLVKIPKKIYWCIRIELLILFLIPLCAVMVAQGLGLKN